MGFRLALAEGAALGAGFAGHIVAAASHADTLGLAPAVVIIGAVLGLAVDGCLSGRAAAGAGAVAAPAAGLEGFTAGLAALPCAGTLNLDTGQVAEVVLVMAAGGH